MSDSDVQEKIAQLEAMRSVIGDAVADAAIAALRASQSAPVQGTVTASDDSTVNQAIGVNYGTVQAFFAGNPTEDGKRLLADYLTSSISECQQMRLSRLTKKVTGKEGQAAPSLRLQAVYTSLTVDRLHDLGSEQMSVADLKRILEEQHPDVVSPEQVRLVLDVPIGLDAFLVGQEQGRSQARGERALESLLDEVPDEQELSVRFTRPMLALEAIATTPRLVLLGEPGAGKSTVLRYLALLLAQKALDQVVDLPGWPDDQLPVPILCPLGAVAEALAQRTDGNARKALWQVLGNVLDGEDGIRAGLRDYLKPAIRNGGVVLLCDGLDEMPTSGTNPRAQIAQALGRFACADAANTPMVVTSRVLPYRAEGDGKLPADEGWEVRTIQPLVFGQVRQFVPLWYHELAVRDEELGTDEAAQRADALIDALDGHERLQPLLRSPLLLTMLAILHANKNELPDDRVVLYEECVLLLLERWEPERSIGVKHAGLLDRLGIPNLRVEQLREELHKLALKTHAQPPGDDGRGLLNRYELTGRMVEFFRRLRCDDPIAAVEMFVQVLNEDAGLLVARGDDAYAFPHLTFQEYLTACGLADRADMVSEAYRVWSGDDADRWREVLLLFVGRLRQRGSLAVEQYGVAWLERLTEQRRGRAEKPARQRHRDAVMAALCYREMGGPAALAGIEMDVEGKVEGPLRAAIVAMLDAPDSGVVVADRLAAAQVLGTLGDPRVPVTVDEWRREWERAQAGDTAGYFCRVDAGRYIIGSRDDEPGADDDEKPQYTVELTQPVWIARYPLTNAQWQAWVDAGGKPSYYADDTDRNHPNQPVVGVSWHMCNEFCAWLREATGVGVRLPTEGEWEAAARGGDARCYPWGDAWVADRAVMDEDQKTRGWRWSVPVGCYAAGAAPCGAMDMAGNVWEWTADVWRSHPGAAKPFEDKNWRVLKGGYYGGSRTYVRCAARYRIDPADVFYSHLGVRLSVSPRIPEHTC